MTDLLDCGCPNDSRPQYTCLYCGHTRCGQHRDEPHNCPNQTTKPEPAATPGDRP